MHRIAALLCLALLLATSTASAQPLRETLKDIEIAPHWIYDDLPAAIEEAKSSGKPLLVVLRCVPCPPGRTLDEQLMRPEGELAELEKNFVCVRVIQTNGLDLATFQFDYDMSWAALFLNADLTVYGRYGTRNSSGPGSDSNLNVTAFRKSAERALALHKAYPGNKAQLAAKTGPAPAYARPEETPGLTDKSARATVRQNCIHCHMVKEFAIRAKWEAGKLTAADLFVYPQPKQIGLEMDLQDGLLVKSVEPGTPAGTAGIQAGDEIVALGGQPLVSTADIQWVLHHAASDAKLPVSLRRGGKTVDASLALAGEWKKSDIAWRASSWYGLRQGVKFEPLPAADKKSRGIEEDRLALVIKNMYGKGGPKLQQAGLKQGDVIVAVDGQDEALSESDFLTNLRLTKGPQDSVTLTVLRGDGRKEFTIPMW